MNMRLLEWQAIFWPGWQAKDMCGCDQTTISAHPCSHSNPSHSARCAEHSGPVLLPVVTEVLVIVRLGGVTGGGVITVIFPII